MQTMVQGYRGLSYFIWLNSDRLAALGMVVFGLLAGAFFGSALLPH